MSLWGKKDAKHLTAAAAAAASVKNPPVSKHWKQGQTILQIIQAKKSE